MGSIRKPATWRVLLAALALFAVACGGNGDSGGDTSSGATDGTDGATDAAAAEGGDISVYIGEPEHLSPPSNVTESNGAEVLNSLYTPLVQVDTDNSKALFGAEEPNAVAENIETEDNKTFTITLKDGWTMHNGEPLTAQNYVDGWNFGAAGPNANTGGYFFSNIQGYEDLQCPKTTEDGACKGTPEATEMSGLKVIDDKTFEVTLNEPFSIFPLVVNYTAFHPVPSDFTEDPEKYVESPVGNGPFKMEGSWEHDQAVTVSRYEDWPGEFAGNVENIEFRIYSEIDTAYNDLLAGNLDVMDALPSAQLEAARQEFGDRIIEKDSPIIQYLGYPIYEKPFDDVKMRRALSMAIDREAIANTIRPDFTANPNFVPQVVPGALEEEGCGGNCEFNPEEAKRLYDEAGGIDGTLTMWLNSGADHEGWVEAVSNQLRENLGVEKVEFESLDFAEYLPKLQNQKVTGPWRLGWIPDYPSPHTYLDSLYSSGASSNYSGYANEEFDELIQQAESAETAEEAAELFQQAETILNEDMPSIPMFTASNQAAWSERLSDVEIGFFDDLNTTEIQVSE